MQHRRRTGPVARGKALASALGVLLAGAAIAVTAGAATGAASQDPAAAVLAAARQQIGDAYQWGGTGPDAWDCSGLTSRMWRDVGGVLDIPRVAQDQQAWAIPIPAEQLHIADLVFFGDPVTHVSLYAGNGTVVDASSSKRGVLERPIWPSDVIRYGRVPRPGMPKVLPWAAPTAQPTPASPATPAADPATQDETGPVAEPPTAPTPPPPTAPVLPVLPAATPAAPTPALVAGPLRGLPAPDLPAPNAVAARATRNAQSVLGSAAWTDTELLRAAWRHAGGGLLPADRAGFVAAGTVVPLGAARIGDVVAYGTPVSHLGLYLGHGYMVDASPLHAKVVVRRVYAAPTVQIIRLPVVR